MKDKEEFLRKIFNNFGDKRILIVGDVMVDAYLFGKVTRISPEAPVPVVDVYRRSNRLGGAANVALNLKTLQATPILCSVIGNDDAGFEISQLLFEEGITTDGLIPGINRKTTKKYRIIGNATQMMRVDEEDNHPLTIQEEQVFLTRIYEILAAETIDAIIFQDYDKGTITPNIIQQLIAWGNERNIPIIVDPKKRNFLTYENATLFKPNLKELMEGMNISIKNPDMELIQNAMLKLQQKLNVDMLMVTLSEQGVIILSEQRFTYIPAHVRTIADVSGAGDTVISVAALCLACKKKPEIIAQLSNLAGGLVCEYVGVVPINRDQFLEEALKLPYFSK